MSGAWCRPCSSQIARYGLLAGHTRPEWARGRRTYFPFRGRLARRQPRQPTTGCAVSDTSLLLSEPHPAFAAGTLGVRPRLPGSTICRASPDADDILASRPGSERVSGWSYDAAMDMEWTYEGGCASPGAHRVL